MKIGQVSDELQRLGWKLSRDEVGDRFGTYHLSDREVCASYSLTSLPGEQMLTMQPAVQIGAFSDACARIRADGNRDDPLVVDWWFPDASAPEIHEHHVRIVSEKAIAWAQEVDLYQALCNHAKFPTFPGAGHKIWHLAALAVLGDVGRLNSYLESFDTGDHARFGTYIKREHVQTALRIAEGPRD